MAFRSPSEQWPPNHVAPGPSEQPGNASSATIDRAKALASVTATMCAWSEPSSSPT